MGREGCRPGGEWGEEREVLRWVSGEVAGLLMRLKG